MQWSLYVVLIRQLSAVVCRHRLRPILLLVRVRYVKHVRHLGNNFFTHIAVVKVHTSRQPVSAFVCAFRLYMYVNEEVVEYVVCL